MDSLYIKNLDQKVKILPFYADIFQYYKLKTRPTKPIIATRDNAIIQKSLPIGSCLEIVVRVARV